VIAFPFENDPVSLISLEEAPTKTLKLPAGMTQACCTTSQMATSRFLNVIWKFSLCPLLISFLLNPRRIFGGSPALSGNPMYTCGTSPSNGPLLCTLKETVRAVSKRIGFPPIPPVGVTVGPAKEAVAFPDDVALPDMVADELPFSVLLDDRDPLPDIEEPDTVPVRDGAPDTEDTGDGVAVAVAECETL